MQICALDNISPTRLHGAMRRRLVGLTAVLFATCTLAGCASSSGQGAGASDGPLRVVAAENFYGDIVRQIGGAHVTVTSILSDPNADPHLFEPGTATGAAVAESALVVENGLGYDAFMEKLLQASPDPNRTVITVADVLNVTTEGANPHLWYNLPRIPEVAAAIADGLSALRPADRSYFQTRLEAFDASLKPLDGAIAQIKGSDGGAPVAYTEPVPGYLLEAAGLVVKTPESFALAIEAGTEPTPQAVAEMEALLTGKQIAVFLYNSQATSPITEHLLQVARQNAIPIVPMTETLPPGTSFQEWQLGQIRALATALSG
jgi:zinc/manganese transport system substrate-binding protein